MTAPVDIAALRALLEQATPLPWSHDQSGVFHVESLGPILDEDRTRQGNAVGIGRVGDSYPRGDNHPTENMALVAAAVNALPALLAELEGLRARDAEYCELADLLTEAAKDLESEIDTRYGYPDVHPSQRNKYNRDSETVTRLQKAADRARGEGR